MSLVYDIPSLFLITSLFYILRAWKLESEHPRLLKTGVDCNQRLQLISKVEIFSNQWFRWSKKGASYGLMPPSLFLLRLCLLLLHKKWEK